MAGGEENGEKDHTPMLAGIRRFASSRSSSMFVRGAAGRRKDSAAAAAVASWEQDGGEDDNVMFHTAPLRRAGPATAQFVPMSGPLYTQSRAPALPPPSTPTAGKTAAGMSLEKKGMGGGGGGRETGHLMMSGQLGLCHDPYCTTCPAAYRAKAAPPPRKQHFYRASSPSDRFNNVLYGDAKGWARRSLSFANSCFPIMNPHAKFVQQWNKFFVISCLVAIFVDPLFFLVLLVDKEHKCIVFDWDFATVIVVVRSMTDFVYLLHMLLQFRLAYVAPESRVVGAGDFVDQPKKIACHYLRGYFTLDLFAVLPLPQVMILVVVPEYVGSANIAKNLLRATILLQYIPRIFRFLPLLGGQSASGFIFESAWANFIINLLMFVLAGHVVGSCWYLFGLQRVNQCLRNACNNSESFLQFIDCGGGSEVGRFKLDNNWPNWLQDSISSDCLGKNSAFNYGIYVQAALITQKSSIVIRYLYSLFWGFQQISTLAGNLVPSDFVWEVLFTMGIIGLGLLLFALLIGNMQNFLQALGKRRLEMQLRRRDVEQWMSHRRLPEYLRRQVRQAERFNWAATRGVNEEELLEILPEDLQRDIRRHLFTFLRKVRIFTLMDEPILDAVSQGLRQKLYTGGTFIQNKGGPVEKMVFIVRGKMEITGEDGHASPLSEGDVCGEELLTWYLDHYSMNKDGGKIRFPGQRLFSNRTVKCITNVEAFALQAADLENVTALFSRFLRNTRVQGAIRYESPYWRTLAATRIQVAWRYRQKRLNRASRSSFGIPRDVY